MIQRMILVLLTLASAREALGQVQWYDHYSRFETAFKESQWERAEAELLKALARKDRSQLNAETYGLNFVDYVPYYWLGVIAFNQGDWQKALLSFNQAEAEGIIQQQPAKYQALKKYREIIATLAQLREQNQRLQQTEDHRLRAHEQYQTLADLIRREEFESASVKLSELETGTAGDPALAALRALLQQAARARQSNEPTSQDPLARKFEEGLNRYAAGNYEAAFQIFSEVAAQDRDYRQVENWLGTTRATMARLNLEPAEKIVTVIEKDTVTVAPLVALISPPKDAFVTRSDSIVVSGSARDEEGIARLEFSINGRSYLDSAGQPITRQPSSAEEARDFFFEVNVPLRLGTNEIVITAYDIDLNPHFSTSRRNVIRKPPLYQTPAFIAGAGVVLALSLGSLAVSRTVKRRIAFINKYNPYIAGAPIRNEKMFFGREKLLERVMNTLRNNSLMIHGPRRIGKTSLQHQLKRCLENETDSVFCFVPVFIDLQGVREERFFAALIEDIREGIQAYNPHELVLQIAIRKENYSARDFSADLRQILEHLQTQSDKQVKLVLLIDEVDQLNHYSERTNQQLRSIFMKGFAEKLVAVMSGSQIRKHWESEGSPWYNFFEEIAVPPLEREAAKALVRAPVHGIFSYEEEALGKILNYSENQPYRIQKFCVNVINRIIAARRRRVTVQDVEAVRAQVLEGEED